MGNAAQVPVFQGTGDTGLGVYMYYPPSLLPLPDADGVSMVGNCGLRVL